MLYSGLMSLHTCNTVEALERSMARHSQLTRQQMADELEAWDKMLQGEEAGHYSAYTLAQIHARIKALIEHLSEYK